VVSGSTPLIINVQRQLDPDALNVVGGCFGNKVFHARDTRMSAVAGGLSCLLVLINQCVFPSVKSIA
jgi:hypothetical protein